MLEFCEKFVGGALSTITLNVAKGRVVTLLGMSSAGIGDQGHQVTQITGVSHCRTDALICQQTADNEKIDIKVTEDVRKTAIGVLSSWDKWLITLSLARFRLETSK